MRITKSEQHCDLSRADRTEDISSLADQQVRDTGGQPHAQHAGDAARSGTIIQGFQRLEHRVTRGYVNEVRPLPQARLGDLPIAGVDTGDDHTCVFDRIIEKDRVANIELARRDTSAQAGHEGGCRVDVPAGRDDPSWKLRSKVLADQPSHRTIAADSQVRVPLGGALHLLTPLTYRPLSPAFDRNAARVS